MGREASKTSRKPKFWLHDKVAKIAEESLGGEMRSFKGKSPVTGTQI